MIFIGYNNIAFSVGSSPSHMQYLLLDTLLPNSNIAQLNFTLIKIWMLLART